MTERAYTVKEIDELRWCCENKYIWGRYNGPVKGSFIAPSTENGFTSTMISRTFREADKIVAVEEMVRTHMAAGHTAHDLIQSEEIAHAIP